VIAAALRAIVLEAAGCQNAHLTAPAAAKTLDVMASAAKVGFQETRPAAEAALAVAGPKGPQQPPTVKIPF
jgi:hypothetical protein